MENLNLTSKAILLVVKKGYKITNEGDILNPKGIKIKKLFNEKDKYYFFGIKDENRKSRIINIHRLQAYQKFGDLIFDNNVVVRHKDNNSLNNSYENIILGSQKENIFDIPSNKRIIKSINSSIKTRKYTNEFILNIRKLLLNKKPKEISLLLNININDIYHIKNYKYLFEKIKDIDNNIDIDKLNISENEINIRNKYDDNFCNELKEQSKTKSYQILSEEYNISKGMIQYLVNR